MRTLSLATTAVPCALGLVLAVGPKVTVSGQGPIPTEARHSINPGLSFRVVSASVEKDGTISVQYRVMDSAGLPLDLTGKETQGAIAVKYQAGYALKGQTHFLSYTTRPAPSGRPLPTLGAEDSGGALRAVSAGEYVYTFGTKAPPGWDAKATHRIVVHGLRDMKQWGLGVKYADTTFDFVPSGGTPESPEVFRHCNTCHGATQAAPDGSPRSEQICIMCHTQLKCAS